MYIVNRKSELETFNQSLSNVECLFNNRPIKEIHIKFSTGEKRAYDNTSEMKHAELYFSTRFGHIYTA